LNNIKIYKTNCDPYYQCDCWNDDDKWNKISTKLICQLLDGCL